MLTIRRLLFLLPLLCGVLRASISVSPLELGFLVEGTEPQGREVSVLNTGDKPIAVRITVEDFGIIDGSANVGAQAGDRSLRNRLVVFPSEATIAPGESLPVRVVLNPDREELAPGSYWAAVMVTYGGGIRPADENAVDEQDRRFTIVTNYRLMVGVFGEVQPPARPYPPEVDVVDLRVEDGVLVVAVENRSRWVRSVSAGRVVMTASDGRQVQSVLPAAKLYPGHVRPLRVDIPPEMRGVGEVGFLVEFDSGSRALIGAEGVFEP